eukprot:5087196-Pleurochrysis_carterae.AAC.1
MCLQYIGLGIGCIDEGFESHPHAKYTVNAETGQLEWKRSQAIDTYYMHDKDAVANYLAFQTRPAAARMAAFGCTKG